MGEQVEEEMKISLSIRIKPLNLDEMDSDELRSKANQIWNTIAVLETGKYDYEQRQLDQDYEFKELKERQKLQLRNKAIKKGLDPESFTGAHPPTIHMFSKYERRTDTRTYGDRKKLYEGGAEVLRAEALESAWKEKFNEWSKRPKAKLPKWFGVRPGKKEGDPETPEGEEEEEEINRIISGLKTEVLSNAKVTSYIPQSSHCFCANLATSSTSNQLYSQGVICFQSKYFIVSFVQILKI